jgi:type I restriction enzyme R subunit
MTSQPEQLLELELIAQLSALGYEKVLLKDEQALVQNFKAQLEKHNKTTLTQEEFQQILLYINKGNIFEHAKTLRSRIPYVNAKGETMYLF